MATSGKRPFWMHQAAEYLMGAAFVASGLQSPEPIVPTLMGGLIMINTACSKGPLSAFRVFGKRIHRLLDAVLVVLILVAAAQPIVEIDNGTRFVMVLLALCMGVIWKQSDFAEHAAKPSRFSPARSGARSDNASAGGVSTAASSASGEQPAGASGAATQPDGSTADAIGRTAGRLAGKGVNLYRSRRAANGQRKT